MKKLLLSAILAFSLITVSQAQTVHKLDIVGLYNQISDGIQAGTETATISGTKILVNTDRTEGIFTLVSPSGRTFRMDVTDVTFTNGATTTARLETNGASNATNGRKIYINCPSAGTLKLGAYSGTAGRGYTVEKPAGTVLFSETLPLAEEGTQYPIYEYIISEAGQIEINPDAAIYYGLVEFVEEGGSSIAGESANKTVISVEYYDVTGRKVAENTQGVILKKLSYDNGTTEVVKTIVK